MQLQLIVDALEAIAPTCHAEAWDNTGLLWGDPKQEVDRILLTNDCTLPVLLEAEHLPCQLIVSYHPPLFAALKKIPPGHVVQRALQADMAVYSPHTAWDAAIGGTNDRLAGALGLLDNVPLRAAQSPGQHKLVFFAPSENVSEITAALGRAGAGHIGNYTGCHFRQEGVGAFLPEPGSRPAIGSVGTPQQVQECRVEMVVSAPRLTTVLSVLRAHHPYEEPAFDLYALEPCAPEGVGMGRIGRLPEVLSWEQTLSWVKRALHLPHVLACAPRAKSVERIAVCAGAGGEFVADAAARGAQILVTGEVRHHEALAAQARGLGLIATLHSNSERLTLPFMAELLRPRVGDVQVHVSACDADPLRII